MIVVARRAILLATMKSWDMASQHIKHMHPALGFGLVWGCLHFKINALDVIKKRQLIIRVHFVAQNTKLYAII